MSAPPSPPFLLQECCLKIRARAPQGRETAKLQGDLKCLEAQLGSVRREASAAALRGTELQQASRPSGRRTPQAGLSHCGAEPLFNPYFK